MWKPKALGFSCCFNAILYLQSCFWRCQHFRQYKFSWGSRQVHWSFLLSLRTLNCLHQLQNVNFHRACEVKYMKKVTQTWQCVKASLSYSRILYQFNNKNHNCICTPECVFDIIGHAHSGVQLYWPSKLVQRRGPLWGVCRGWGRSSMERYSEPVIWTTG